MSPQGQERAEGRQAVRGLRRHDKQVELPCWSSCLNSQLDSDET